MNRLSNLHKTSKKLFTLILYNAKFFHDNPYSRSPKYLLTPSGILKIITSGVMLVAHSTMGKQLRTWHLNQSFWVLSCCSRGSVFTLLFQKPCTFMGLFLSALGLMMIFEGIPFFCAPSRIKVLAQKIGEIPDQVLRIIGFASMLVGLTVVYFGRSLFENN